MRNKTVQKKILTRVILSAIGIGFSALIFPLFANESQENKNLRFEKVFKNLELVTLEQKKLKMSEFDSQIVLINFWASWCIPCLEEIPSLINLSKKFDSSKLLVIGINTDKENQLNKIKKTKKSLNIPDSVLIVPDKDFKIADEFKFSSIPVTIFYKKGKVIQFTDGPVNFDPKAKEIPKDLW